MGSQAFAGVGTKFQRWNGATWDDVAEVNAIEGPGMTKDTLEVTSLDTDAGYNEFITGFAEGGTVTLDMNFTRETYELMKDDFESDVVQNYRIQLADYDSEPSTFTFGGLVIELPMGISADDKVTADVVIQVTSQVILDIGSTVPEDFSWSAYWEQQWYGIEIDEANTSPDVTRIASDMTEHDGTYIHAVLPVHAKIKACLLNDDGTVNYYLDPTDWSKQVGGAASNLDGSDGQVMIEWPDFYYKVETDYPSAGKHQIKISCSALSGFTLVPKHYVSAYEANIQRSASKFGSFKNTGADYRGGNNTAGWDAAANSLLGMPVTNVNRTNGRTYARARGAGWNLYGYNDHKWLFWLFAIEYATLNSQKAVNAVLTAEGYKQGGLGAGVSTAVPATWNTFNSYNPFVPCGASDSLASGSGEYTYTKTDFGGVGVDVDFTVNRYRGHEMPFGHIWMILDGVNVNIQAADSGGESQVWVSDNPAAWNDANYTGYTNRGLMHRADGYMSKALLGAGAEFVPSEAGVSGSWIDIYYCDYCYTSIPASGISLRMLVVGGCAPDGSGGGFACSVSNYTPSDARAHFGSRLRYQ